MHNSDNLLNFNQLQKAMFVSSTTTSTPITQKGMLHPLPKDIMTMIQRYTLTPTTLETTLHLIDFLLSSHFNLDKIELMHIKQNLQETFSHSKDFEPDVAKAYIKHTMNKINFVIRDYQSQILLEACEKAEQHVILWLLSLEAGFNLSIKSWNGVTLLMLAAERGYKEIVALLLEKGAHINDQGEHRWSALLLAANSGHKEVVALLLEKGANINDKTDNGWSALLIAAENGHKEVVALLLENGANIDDQENLEWSSLMLAAYKGHKPVVSLLLENAANILYKTKMGGTALLIASEYGHTACVELLLRKGANIHDKTDNGYSALLLAAQNGHTALVALLLEKGATIDDAANNKGTALMLAALNGHTAIVALLLENGANIHPKSHDGWTALMYAAIKGHKDIVALLMQKGANIREKESKGWTPLMLTVQSGDNEIAELFVEKGVNVYDKNLNGSTALKIAADNGHFETVELLKTGPQRYFYLKATKANPQALEILLRDQAPEANISCHSMCAYLFDRVVQEPLVNKKIALLEDALGDHAFGALMRKTAFISLHKTSPAVTKIRLAIQSLKATEAVAGKSTYTPQYIVPRNAQPQQIRPPLVDLSL